MEKKKQDFLHYAVVKQLKYEEIETKLGLNRKTLTLWWDELKEEREHLSKIRMKWKDKCSEIDFYDFKEWFEKADKKCFYCEITEKEIQQLWKKHPKLTKSKRGKVLEIERKEPNEPYDKISNLVFSCYWCNNAKTDTFTEEEFIKIGKVIKNIWEERLNDSR